MSSTAITELREAGYADLPLIQSLAQLIWREVYPEIITPDQIEYMLERMYAPAAMEREMTEESVRYCLFTLSGSCEGFAAYGDVDTQSAEMISAESSGTVVMIHKIYLRPALHGQGHGSRMLQLLEADIIRERPTARSVALRVNKNNHRAIRAYERNGYEVAGTICSEIGDGFVMDDYWIVKRLRRESAKGAEGAE